MISVTKMSIKKFIGGPSAKPIARPSLGQIKSATEPNTAVPVEKFEPSASQSASPKKPDFPKSQMFEPVLQTVELSEEQKRTPVSRETVDKAQKLLDKGDRGGAYLTLYKELGSEQVLAQAQITTYTGLWGSGAMAGNSKAKDLGGGHYNIPLDQFSTDIAQGTIDGIRQDLDNGGTGRLSESQFRAVDRQVWKDKNMGDLFPGNVQFWDPWNHVAGDRAAIISRSTISMAKVALRSCLGTIGITGGALGLNTILRVGKRPAEFAQDPNYEIHGDKSTRFITVVDKRTGFVEAFWDNKPKFGKMRVPQLDNEAIDHDSPVFKQRNFLYDKLGANVSGQKQVARGESNPAIDDQNKWFFA
jgi:hypothetical protein